MSERLVRRLLIAGRVQGVGFRAWLEGQAVRRGIDGWVRNRRDGLVEALLSGPVDAVREVIGACDSGPPGARVERVEVSEEHGAVPEGFQQRPTA